MPPFAECCVIIPCSTIEDFPSRLDSAGAQSLLGGLTAAWHPRLLAATRRTPSWHRSDEAPPPIRVPTSVESVAGDPLAEPMAGAGATGAGDVDAVHVVSDAGSTTQPAPVPATLRRLLIIPEVCVSTLPAEVREGIDRNAVSLHDLPTPQDPAYGAACEVRIRVSSRGDALDKLAAAIEMFAGADPAGPSSLPGDHLRGRARTETTSGIDEGDFFALGYMWWQTQILTRRLRYTSNLDQMHFESRLVAAAEHYVAGDEPAAIDALHDCYDALAEERDHYFSSDPAIIDLTLMTPSTLDGWLDGLSRPSPTLAGDAAATRRTGLGTPENILVDEALAAAILQGDQERCERFRACLKPHDDGADEHAHETIGWCGGGPASDFAFDASSIATSERRIADAIRTVQECGAAPLPVYARLGGGVAGEWVPAIAAAGFRGIIPIDFLGGRGFDEESKVLLGEGDYEIEALTAKPIDANDEKSFLTLSAELGEAIDRGEIATALLAHWPGGGCDSFHDIRRAASWSLCLGKFWRIDEYFTDGERPFHHGASPNTAPAPVDTLGELFARRQQLAADLRAQHQQNLRGFAALLAPSKFLAEMSGMEASQASISDAQSNLKKRIAAELGFGLDADPAGATAASENLLLLHPAHPAARTAVTVAGKVSVKTSPVFHAESIGTTTRLIADVPAWGFALVGAAATRQAGDDATAPSAVQNVMRWFTGGARRLVDGNQFSNEFMEVTIDRRHGGIDAVYSGPGRGNRFSMRLLISPRSKIDPESKTDATASKWQTVCTRLETIEDTKHRAVIELAGEFRIDPDGSAETNATSADAAGHPTKWQAQYSLERGSRRLLYRVRFDAHSNSEASVDDAWKSSPVLRMAMAEAAPIVRSISREKLIRTSARSFTSSLGFVIDEETRSTLIACEGPSVHRRCGDRFYDTLVAAEQNAGPLEPAQQSSDQSDWTSWQSFSLGFDVRQSVASAKMFALGDQITSVPVKIQASGSESRALGTPTQRGWLMHPSPISLDVQVVSVGRVTGIDEGRACMAMQLRIVQTAGRSVAASLRFCRDLHSAYEISSLSRPFENDPTPGELSLTRLREISNPDSVACQGDRVSWSQRSHGVIHIIVLFPLNNPA